MRLQHIKDAQGKDAGVFIPIEDWSLLKTLYPDIESAGNEIPAWHQALLDVRLLSMAAEKGAIEDGEELCKELK